MKAKTLMGMIACASACAVSVNVLAEDLSWFDGKVNTTTSALPTAQNATWTPPTGDGAITYSTGKITLDNSSDNLLVLAPPASSEPTLSDGVVTITATALLTPTDASALESVTGAKAGFAVGIENNVKAFYGFAAGLAVNNATGWVKLTGETPPSDDTTETSFKIVLDYRPGKKTVKFYVGTTPTLLQDTSSNSSFSIGDATALTDVAAYGSGSISALAASCEKAVAAVDTNGTIVKYGSIADALDDGGTSATIVDVGANGATGTSTAANGLPVAVCKALGISTTEATTPAVAIEPAASDSDASNINFKLADSVTVETGVAVTFAVKKNGTEEVDGSPFASNAIKIPLSEGTGVYTIVPAGVQ